MVFGKRKQPFVSEVWSESGAVSVNDSGMELGHEADVCQFGSDLAVSSEGKQPD